MQLELHLSNEKRVLPSVQAMTHAALQSCPLDPSVAEKLEELTLQKVTDAIEHAYPPGESGTIKLVLREKQGQLEIRIRDFGLPQDVVELEERLHAAGVGIDHSMADEVHWLSFGREGKAFQLLKWLPESNITQSALPGELTPFDENVELAPPMEYEIRRLQPGEAVQVSQLMYRAYGNTYFNEDVYYPERVAAQNEHNVNLSFVAVGTGGVVAGHYALELNQSGPVAEGGQAVVDPAHRGRGLLNQLKAAALKEAESLGLAGWYADAVAVHTFTQQSNATHGGHLTAVELAIAPKTEMFRNIAAQQSQRVTCLLYFHWLKPALPRKISVPERHREIVSRIYANLGCPVEFREGISPTGLGVLSVKSDSGGAKAFIRVEEPGTDTLRTIRYARTQLIERSHMDAVYVELPLENAATAELATALEGEGFGFLGIAPHFSQQGDVLRMAYLVDPLEREPIKTFEPFADELVNYVLAEQARVRA
ncbi:GNAT family N-acetyltransferase [Planctomicrobium sp. SH661]|uniref:GNAT family N-acetyltransferase n=1 Tax=Planctomicrobium sp. SH661 TaxID=3448124 RepID=UPI003F5C857B